VFAPGREHARFCSAACRVAWNREHTEYPGVEASALDWSITAMRDAVERLAYEAALTAQGPVGRQAAAGTLAGLRFVRNRMGYHEDPAEFIQPGHGRPGSDHGVAVWKCCFCTGGRESGCHQLSIRCPEDERRSNGMRILFPEPRRRVCGSRL
jgi:hypothetical protein